MSAKRSQGWWQVVDDGFGFGFGLGTTDDAKARQRGTNRDSMFLQAQIRRADGGEHVLRVRNLSAGGLMADTVEPFVEGEAIRVGLRGIGEVGARIAWRADGRVGIAFDRPVDPKLARKAPPQSPGANILLTKVDAVGRRPGLKPR